jgi:hypothetical protein
LGIPIHVNGATDVWENEYFKQLLFKTGAEIILCMDR